MLFVSVCLFFNSSRSLLIDSYIFSVLFSRFSIILKLIILNSFSGSLTISSSFIWTCVFILCSFTCVVCNLYLHSGGRRWVFFPLMDKAEWGSNPVCWWLGLYFCLVCCLDDVSCTTRVLLVVGWCWVLYTSGCLCGSSHYLILPRVRSSLIV